MTGGKATVYFSNISHKMRTKYCCDSKSYERYYLQQVGNGTPFFSGARYQKGYGLGNVFSSIGKSVIPLIKSGAKAIGKEVIRSGVGFASDLLAGKNAKQAAIHRAKTAGSNLLQTAMRKRKAPSTRVQKKRRKKSRDIFS